MATSSSDELAALIERIHSTEPQNAWETIRSVLKNDFLQRLHEVLDDLSEDESEPDAGLAERLERTFWRDLWPKRADLPRTPEEFVRQLTQKAVERARDIGADYQNLRRLIARCHPNIRSQLVVALGIHAEDHVQTLESQVIKRLWDVRESLSRDCSDFRVQVDEIAHEIGIHSVLFSKAAAGDQAAMEQVFTMFRDFMMKACSRAYPEIPEHAREDILHNALLSIFKNISKALDPDQISTWRAFLRMVVIRAGRKWRANNRRFVLESELGAGQRG